MTEKERREYYDTEKAKLEERKAHLQRAVAERNNIIVQLRNEVNNFAKELVETEAKYAQLAQFEAAEFNVPSDKPAATVPPNNGEKTKTSKAKT